MGGASATDSRRLVGVARLVHPFPSLLDGAAVLVIAWLAGADLGQAILLGAAMTLLQFAIGAVNDVVDTPRDAGLRPDKPIPAGLVTRQAALWVAIGTAVAGLAAALAISPVAAAIGLLVLGIGLAYDLRFKGTALSWLPFAVGIPILPLFGWMGARGTLPAAFGVVLPVAFLEGAALAIANTLVDVERDRASGVASVATTLGSTIAARSGLVLQVAVAAVAIGAGAVMGHPVVWIGATSGAGAVLVAGAELSRRASESQGPGRIWRRELAWRIQALGAAVLAACWLAGAGAAGVL